ncbi:Maf family protein [Inmirania thermothiophila]|uniref:7-methyl-GTP pyrophosphatase n=1 Tax=Inmirania thermothiophila TaxID=1750597 RepID=A0A3N1Y1D2_9GAMM|nr:nucleoside triphosphate pyrophosphatase [Inmirania thermothiophila]ROR32643.1 MAF protein [Inmirania thermothiophila]
MSRRIVLASTSPYRRELLARLGLPFATAAPGVDETPRAGEAPAALVARLAEAKARAVAPAFPDALVIGSDQVAVLEDGTLLTKPGGHERARAQLAAASGRTVTFLTGLCLLDAATGAAQTDVVPFRVRFRTLDPERIERYLARERPYDCAGSFRSEGLGIALFRAMEGEDPTALVGLPLIRLVDFLAAAGVAVP